MIPAINLTDGYKVDHRRQMPENTLYQLNNFTPRKTRRENVDRIVFFGLQYFIKKYLIEEFNRTFFGVNIDVAVSRYKRRIDNYLGPDHEVTFDHIRELHTLGFLPIKIKALPEGTRVNIKVPPVTIESTMGKQYMWLVGYLETLFSCVIWGPCTSATTAYEYRSLLNKFAKETVGNTDFVPFQGHDFSFRGMFGVEAAVTSGAAHLLSFVGTDTIPAIDFLEEYYNANSDKELVGCSVAATEHSVMCMGTGLFVYDKLNGDWSKIGDAEFEVFKRLITEVYPKRIVSIVSDTFNLWKVLTEFLPKLKNEILAREGKVVIRPDSGDPVDILCGEFGFTHNENDELVYTGDNQVTDPKALGVIESLWNTFGGTTTEKGFKLLDSHIGAIYGDSITIARATAINTRLKEKGFASINWVAGIGSFTYQYVTRDTDGWAMKATYGEVLSSDGKVLEIPIFKDPITDDGTKKSARGLIQVVRHVQGDVMKNRPDSEWFELRDQVSKKEFEASALELVFKDGNIVREHSLSAIRARIEKSLKSEE